jgi:hypothetical protein
LRRPEPAEVARFESDHDHDHDVEQRHQAEWRDLLAGIEALVAKVTHSP